MPRRASLGQDWATAGLQQISTSTSWLRENAIPLIKCHPIIYMIYHVGTEMGYFLGEK
jgi:hypothetical protein